MRYLRQLVAILLLCATAHATSYTFSTNAPTNPFGTDTSVYHATFGGPILKTPGGDCLVGYHQGSNHATSPSFTVMQRQTGCSGLWAAYSGTAWDLSGDAHCDGAGLPSGCVFSDNVNNSGGNWVSGCALVI